MRIGQPAYILPYLPIYMTIDELDYEVHTYDTPKDVLVGLSKNEIDLSIGDPFLQNYFDFKKNHINIFCDLISKSPISLITFNPFIKDFSKKMLNGKTLITFLNPSTSYFIGQSLKTQFKLGEIITTQFNTEFGFLISQEVDIALSFEPNITYAIENGANELYDFSQDNNATTSITINNKNKLDKNELKKFKDKLIKNIERFYSDEEYTLEIAKKYFGLIDTKILIKAINKLRSQKIYCNNLKFEKSEIENTINSRKLELTVNDFEKLYLNNFYLKLLQVKFGDKPFWVG